MRRSIADRSAREFRALLVRVFVFAAVAGCSSPPAVPAPVPVPTTLTETVAPASTDLYRDGGFIVGNGSIPFVGLVRFAGTEFLDSTAVVVALSIPPRALAFVRAGDRYVAFYAVRIDLQSGETITRSERPLGEVRVASFAETNRAEDGVIFQRSLRVAPGSYTLRLTAYDSLGAGTGTATTTLAVPRMSDGAVASMIPVFTAEPRKTRDGILAVVTNPKSTVRYGRDSLLQFYIETYGRSAPDTVVVMAKGDGDATLFTESLPIPPESSVRGVVASIPVSQLDLGRNRIVAARPNGTVLGEERAIVTLGVDLPVTRSDELAEALRFFANDAELQGLRGATRETRPAQWAALLRKTDPNPTTQENEALAEYARRLRLAAARFREGPVPGWKTDRGSVLAALGEPEAVIDPAVGDPGNGGLAMTWDYKRHRLLLVFADSTGSGTWKLTPSSLTDFRTLLAFAGPCVGCR